LQSAHKTRAVVIKGDNQDTKQELWLSRVTISTQKRAVVIKGDNQDTKQELWLSRVTISTQNKSCGYQG
jgi:hypothetical protein